MVKGQNNPRMVQMRDEFPYVEPVPGDLAALPSLAQPLDQAATQKVLALKTDIDDFAVHGREVYWLCRRKQSESTFSNVLFEKKLGVQATFRSASTVGKLAAKYAAHLAKRSA